MNGSFSLCHLSSQPLENLFSLFAPGSSAIMLPVFAPWLHLFFKVMRADFLIGYCMLGQTHTHELMKWLCQLMGVSCYVPGAQGSGLLPLAQDGRGGFGQSLNKLKHLRLSTCATDECNIGPRNSHNQLKGKSVRGTCWDYDSAYARGQEVQTLGM